MRPISNLKLFRQRSLIVKNVLPMRRKNNTNQFLRRIIDPHSSVLPISDMFSKRSKIHLALMLHLIPNQAAKLSSCVAVISSEEPELEISVCEWCLPESIHVCFC